MVFNDSLIKIPSLIDRILYDDSIIYIFLKYIIEHLIKRMCNFYNMQRISKLLGFLINLSIIDYPNTYKIVSKMIVIKENDNIIRKLINRASNYLLNCCCIICYNINNYRL